MRSPSYPAMNDSPDILNDPNLTKQPAPNQISLTRPASFISPPTPFPATAAADISDTRSQQQHQEMPLPNPSMGIVTGAGAQQQQQGSFESAEFYNRQRHPLPPEQEMMIARFSNSFQQQELWQGRVQQVQEHSQPPTIGKEECEEYKRRGIELVNRGHSVKGMNCLMIAATKGNDPDAWYLMASVYGKVPSYTNDNSEQKGDSSTAQNRSEMANNEYLIRRRQAALFCLVEAAKRKHGQAALDLADAYFFGCSPVPQNHSTSFYYLLHAHYAGVTAALPRVANAYLRGIGVRKDPMKAVEFLEQADQSGVSDATYMLYGLFAGKECDIPRDERKAAFYLVRAAERGDGGALLELGDCYERGDLGFEKNANEAIKCFKQAADIGNVEAMYVMGDIFESPPQGARSHVTQRNLMKSLKYYTMAANRGHIESMKILADKYSQGDGVPLNKEFAARLLKAAADKGDDESAYRLGVLYETGQWVQRDREKAKEMFAQGAENGNIDALAELTGSWKM